MYETRLLISYEINKLVSYIQYNMNTSARSSKNNNNNIKCLYSAVSS